MTNGTDLRRAILKIYLKMVKAAIDFQDADGIPRVTSAKTYIKALHPEHRLDGEIVTAILTGMKDNLLRERMEQTMFFKSLEASGVLEEFNSCLADADEAESRSAVCPCALCTLTDGGFMADESDPYVGNEVLDVVK